MIEYILDLRPTTLIETTGKLVLHLAQYLLVDH